jgi:hypothetical protein
MAGKLRKALRKIGGGMKKVIRTVAKPFKKVMGFMGRLGWVGTLAMMIAMPYISGFWGTITEGISAGIGGAAADAATQEAMKLASQEAIKQATIEGVSQEAIKKAGVEASKAAAKKAATTVGEKIGSRFISETGKATGLFAKGPMAKALGYTLKSMQIGISGIGKVYSKLTDLVTAGVDFIAQPLMKEGMSFTDSMSTWVGDRFNEARSAMGMKTSKGWSPATTKTASVANPDEVDFTTTDSAVKTTTPKSKTDLKASSTVDAEILTDQSLEKADIGNLKDKTQDDYLKKERNLLDAESSITRQTSENMHLISDDGTIVDIYGNPVVDLTTVDESLLAMQKGEDDLGFFQKGWQNLKESAGETWRGKYEQQPIYVATGIDDDRIYLDFDGKPLPKGLKQTGVETIKTPGVQGYIRDPEKIVKKGAEYAMGEVEDYLDPQRLIQDKIDETIGLKKDQQVTIVQEYKPANTLIDMPEGYARLPDLPESNYLAIANHTRNINNGDYFASPYDYKVGEETKPYALPGYFGSSAVG